MYFDEDDLGKLDLASYRLKSVGEKRERDPNNPRSRSKA